MMMAFTCGSQIMVTSNGTTITEFCFPMPSPPLYKGVKLGLFTGLYAFVFVIGVFGNFLTSFVIFKTKDLHTNTNFFLCNLACSDLILLISGIPFDVLYIWRPYPAIAGTWFCILKGWLSETASNVSILTILLLTLERWVAVCWPLHLFIIFDRSNIFRYILFIWCIGGTVALTLSVQLGVVPYYHTTKNLTLENITQCDVVPSRTIPFIFEVFSILFFVIPIIVIVGSYASIVRELKRPSDTISALGNMNQPQLRARYLITKMCILVSIIFIICFLPLHVQRLLTTYMKHHMQESLESASFIQTWFVVSGLLHFVSAASNPVIYNALSKRFRLTCIQFIRSMCRLGGLDWSTDSKSNQTTQLTSMRTRLVAWLFRRRSTTPQQFSCKMYHFIDANGNEPVVNQEDLL